MRLVLIASTLVLVAGAIGAPGRADAQVWKRVKEKATEKIVDRTVDKVKDRRNKADSAVEARAARTVDSTANLVGRGVDSTMDRVGRVADTTTERIVGVADTAVARSGRGVGRAVKGESALARQLTGGRAVITTIRFAPDGSLDPSSKGVVRELASLLKGREDAWALESHTDERADAQAISDARARSLKAALVAEGVSATQVWARGYGASRAATAGVPADRIEVTRMQ